MHRLRKYIWYFGENTAEIDLKTVSEYKLYAKGVGPVVAVSVSGENEREDLVSYQP